MSEESHSGGSLSEGAQSSSAAGKTSSPTACPLEAGLPPVPSLPATPSEISDPWWWRAGSFPFVVLLLVVAASECAWPDARYGLGAGISCALATLALLLLRRDISRGEQIFLSVLAVVNLLALALSGSVINLVAGLAFPLALFLLVPRRKKGGFRSGRFLTWWEYWFAHRPRMEKEKQSFLRHLLPLLISILVGVVLFIVFLCIFASGNPVVLLVWETLVGWWNHVVSCLNISWDFVLHVLYWLLGIAWFGLYTLPRSEPTQSVQKTKEEPEGVTLLPHLPLFSLIGVNLAFLVATSTDILFLWFRRVPEGVSQTSYLYEGAASITWAAVLAAGILLFFFRRRGSARRSSISRLAGYALVIQTFLLAVSVYLRLYHQVADYGFTPRRVQAAEALLLGLGGLVVLLCYMSCTGRFWKCVRACGGTMLLMLVSFSIYSPSRMAGDLNLCFAPTHSHWKFSRSDFGPTRFQIGDHLEFAAYVQRTDPDEAFGKALKVAAHNLAWKGQHVGWRGWTFFLSRDAAVAERLLAEDSARQTDGKQQAARPALFRSALLAE